MCPSLGSSPEDVSLAAPLVQGLCGQKQSSLQPHVITGMAGIPQWLRYDTPFKGAASRARARLTALTDTL